VAELPGIRPAGLTRLTEIRGSAAAARAMSSSFDSIRRAAQQVNEILEPALVERARQQGREAAESGEVDRRTVLNAEDAAFNAAAEARLLAKARMDADRAAIRLSTDHAADPEGFEKAASDFVNEYVSGAPLDFNVEIQDMLDARMNAGLLTVSREQKRVTAEEAKLAILQQRQNVMGQIETLVDTAGDGAIGGEEYESLVDEVLALNDQLVDNPVIPYTEEQGQAFLRDFELRVSGSVMEQDIAGVFNEKGVSAALDRADELARDESLQISSDARQDLHNRLRTRVRELSEIENARWAEERRAEARAAAQIEQIEAAAAEEMQVLALQDQLTAEWLIENRGRLSATALSAGRQIVSSDGGDGDDLVFAQFSSRARRGEEIESEALQAVAQGLISGSQFSTLMNTAESAQSDTLQAGVDLIDAGFAQSPLAGFSTVFESKRAEAEAALFDWFEENPEAEREDVRDQARSIARRFGGAALVDPDMPPLWNGARPVTLGEVDRLEQSLLEADMPEDQLRQEAAKLEAYRDAIEAMGAVDGR